MAIKKLIVCLSVFFTISCKKKNPLPVAPVLPEVPSASTTVSSVTPLLGEPGTLVTIEGSFDTVGIRSQVNFNGKKAEVQTVSPTQLKVTVPDGAGSGKIEIKATKGTFTAVEKFTYYDVYVIGRELKGASFNTKIWKNGIPTVIKTDVASFNPGELFAATRGGNTYIVSRNFQPDPGSAYKAKAKYLLNSQVVNLTDGSTQAEANSIAVSGKDVYAAGFDNAGIVYWKNGTEIRLSVPGQHVLEGTTKIQVRGSDVYVAAVEDSQLKVWKNGQAAVVSSNNGFIKLTDLFVDGSDVYISSYSTTAPGYRTRIYKNGVEVTGSSSSFLIGSITSVGKLGDEIVYVGYGDGDVFTSGYSRKRALFGFLSRPAGGGDASSSSSSDPNASKFPNAPKSSLTPLSNGKNDTFASSIATVGENVYAAGSAALNVNDLLTAVYWKNGVQVNLTDDARANYGSQIVLDIK